MSQGEGSDATAGPAPRTAASPVEKGALADPSTVDFRVVTFEGARHALKLERIFWSLLEAAAAASNERLGAYISRIIANSAEATNKSSLLRSHAADWMRRKLVDVSASSLSRRSLNGIVQAAPTPCFVVTPQNAIEIQNAAFLDLLNARAGDEGIGAATIRIAFHSELRTLNAKFEQRPVPFLTDWVNIDVGGNRSRHEARIVSIDTISGRGTGLLVFLTT